MYPPVMKNGKWTIDNPRWMTIPFNARGGFLNRQPISAAWRFCCGISWVHPMPCTCRPSTATMPCWGRSRSSRSWDMRFFQGTDWNGELCCWSCCCWDSDSKNRGDSEPGWTKVAPSATALWWRHDSTSRISLHIECVKIICMTLQNSTKVILCESFNVIVETYGVHFLQSIFTPKMNCQFWRWHSSAHRSDTVWTPSSSFFGPGRLELCSLKWRGFQWFSSILLLPESRNSSWKSIFATNSHVMNLKQDKWPPQHAGFQKTQNMPRVMD